VIDSVSPFRMLTLSITVLREPSLASTREHATRRAALVRHAGAALQALIDP
jgi:hypothetical protein